jgi:glycosyltransferase involved in cell wall biosynthesis
VVFGSGDDPKLPVPCEQLGIVSPERLSWVYSEGTAGLCVSLTNYSLIPQEMMACGMPCVDLAGGSTEAELGSDGGVELAEADPVGLADALEALLGDDERWERRSRAGIEMAARASWERAGEQVEAGLREALREREALTTA